MSLVRAYRSCRRSEAVGLEGTPDGNACKNALRVNKSTRKRGGGGEGEGARPVSQAHPRFQTLQSSMG
eukprot:492058-Hanusia_phi.AAC.1